MPPLIMATTDTSAFGSVEENHKLGRYLSIRNVMSHDRRSSTHVLSAQRSTLVRAARAMIDV